MPSGPGAFSFFCSCIAFAISSLQGFLVFASSMSSASEMAIEPGGGGRLCNSSKHSPHLFSWSYCLLSVLSCLSLMGFDAGRFFSASLLVSSYKSFILCWFAADSASSARLSINSLLSRLIALRTSWLASLYCFCASLLAALVLLLLILSFSFLLFSILLRVSVVIHSLCWFCFRPRVSLDVYTCFRSLHTYGALQGIVKFHFFHWLCIIC